MLLRQGSVDKVSPHTCLQQGFLCLYRKLIRSSILHRHRIPSPRPKCLDHLDSVRWECTLGLRDVKTSKTSLWGGRAWTPPWGGARPPSISCISMACINTAGVTQRTRTVRPSHFTASPSTSSEHVYRGVNLLRLMCCISLE